MHPQLPEMISYARKANVVDLIEILLMVVGLIQNLIKPLLMQVYNE